jgi:hypothetical protein
VCSGHVTWPYPCKRSPLSLYLKITYNMIVLVITCPTYLPCIDDNFNFRWRFTKGILLPLQNQLNQISSNLQDIWIKYSFHGALSFPYDMFTNCLCCFVSTLS